PTRRSSDLTNSPIPLGGIVVKRSLDAELKLKINRLVRESVQFAFENPRSGLDYIRSHAQEMEEDVMYKHIDLYVNTYSEHLGNEGRSAIQQMFDKARAIKLIPTTDKRLFLTPGT